MAVTNAQVQALYIAYFNRPADFFGLTYQVAQANEKGLQYVADQFSKSPEFLATYAGKGTGEIIDTIYMNLFGRHAEPAGLKFWGDLLTNPASGVTLGNAALTIFNGALNDDAKAVANKLTAAQLFYDSLDTNAEIVGYSGDAANQVVKAWMSTITDDASLAANTTPVALATVEANAIAAHDGATAVNSVFTTGVDSLKGSTGADIFTGIIGAGATIGGLDSVDGVGGNDTLVVNDLTGGTAFPTSLLVSHIGTVKLASVGAATIDTSGTNFAGLQHLSITRAGGAVNAIVGDGTDVTVVSAAANTVNVTATDSAVNVTANGFVTVDGGSTQTINTAGGMDLSNGTDAIVAVDSAQGANTTTIADGSTVSLTTSVALLAAAAHTDGTVDISGATGAITLVENVKGIKSANATAGDITISDGTIISVTENATQGIATQSTTPGATTTNYTVTQSAMTVTGGDSTTSVTLKQTAAVAKVDSITATTAVPEVDSLTFASLANNLSVTVAGLTFTNTSGATLTAAKVAAAFANLSSGATHGTAVTGAYSGKFISGWSTGAANATTGVVNATQATAVTAAGPTLTTTGVAVAVVTAGVAGVDAQDGVGGIVNGVDTVSDLSYGTATANTIKSVTLDGFATGSAVSSNALTSLSLANSDAVAVTVSNNTATTLGLALNGITGASSLTIDGGTAGTYKALNITTATASSALDVTASGVTALTISGTKSVNLTSATVGHLGNASTALKTVVVSGSAGVTANFAGAATTDVNASATSGSVTVTIDGSKATYEGGSGTDKVTLSSATVAKAITLGAGNDTLTLASGTTTLGAVISGGDGTDILSMAAADAATASSSNTFMANFNAFEKLKLGVAAGNSVDLANMNNINYVISSNSATVAAAAEVQTLDFTGETRTDGNITVAGVTVAVLAADTVQQTADKVVAALNAVAAGTAIGDATATNGGGTSPIVTITYTSAYGDVAQATVAPGTAATTAVAAGTTTTGAVGGASPLTLLHMANNGTLELVADGAGVTVTMNDATGTADAFNLVLNKAGVLAAGSVSVAGVETVNITATDSTSNAVAGANVHTMTLVDSSAKSIVVTGNAGLNLTSTNTTVTSVDASGMTGGLTYTTAGTTAETVKGGASANTLTAHTGTVADTLIGGAGNDTITSNGGLSTLTGNGGNDKFLITNSANVTSFSTITDINAGDRIVFSADVVGGSGVETFTAAKITLDPVAVFQDYANAAINAGGAAGANGYVAWFQYGGNTYVVESRHDAVATHDFQNGTDSIVKLIGLVDLSTATLNTADTVYAGATILLH